MKNKNDIRQWLANKTIDIFLGYRLVDGHAIPHACTRDNLDEIEELTDSDTRYPLEKIALHLNRRHPEAKIGMIARDCNKRALSVLEVWNQMDSDIIKPVTVNCCPSPSSRHADCSYLEPEKDGDFKRRAGIARDTKIEEIESCSESERLSRWMYEFQKCIKCYGCRNICPVCFCNECSLEHEELVHPGRLPPETPIFHLARATHMAGRCIDCGLCEEACPMDIPLRLLYRKVNSIVSTVFGYDAGTSSGQSPFSMIDRDISLTPRPLEDEFENSNGG